MTTKTPIYRFGATIGAMLLVSACSVDQSTSPVDGVLLAGGRAKAVVTQTAAYIANNHDQSVSVIDLSTGSVVGSPIALAANPYAIAAAGSRAVVTLPSASAVSVIDLATNTLVGAPIAVGPSPYSVALSPGGSKAYVANQGNGTVSVIDLASNSVVATITVGDGPWGIAVSRDGMRGYVSNTGSNNISVLDLATNAVIAPPIAVGSGPFGVAVAPSGKMFVANYFGNTVSVIDPALHAVVATIPVGINPRAVTVSADGSKVLVTNVESRTVSIIDAASLSVVATLASAAQAFSIAWAPDGKAYTANLNLTLSAIDIATNSISGVPIPVPFYPTDIAIATRTLASLTVPEQCTSLRNTVLQMTVQGKMSSGRGNSLIAKLNDACKHYDNGKFQQASNAMKAFVSDVNSQMNPKNGLSAADAAILIAAANALVALFV